MPDTTPVSDLTTSLDTTSCPQCDAIAEVLDRSVVDSTDGPVELARIACIDRHHFLLPVEHLARVIA